MLVYETNVHITKTQNQLILLTWFMPALVNKRVGSFRGMVEEEGTNLWSCFLKYSINICRMSLADFVENKR